MENITIKELKETGCRTWTIKDNSVRGCKTVSIDDLQIGEKVLINNHFVEIIEEAEEVEEMKNINDRILEAIKEMDDSEIVSIWNEYCRNVNNYDDEILDSYELEEMIKSSNDAMNWLNRFYFGHDENDENSSANPNRNYFCFNGYGNIVSFDYIYNQFSGEFYNIDIESLIDYIVENNDSLYNDELQEILEELEEVEE